MTAHFASLADKTLEGVGTANCWGIYTILMVGLRSILLTSIHTLFRQTIVLAQTIDVLDMFVFRLHQLREACLVLHAYKCVEPIPFNDRAIDEPMP